MVATIIMIEDTPDGMEEGSARSCISEDPCMAILGSVGGTCCMADFLVSNARLVRLGMLIFSQLIIITVRLSTTRSCHNISYVQATFIPPPRWQRDGLECIAFNRSCEANSSLLGLSFPDTGSSFVDAL